MYIDEQLLKLEAEEFLSSNSKLYRYIYNQALEDFEMKIKECCLIVGSCDFEDMTKIKEQLIK